MITKFLAWVKNLFSSTPTKESAPTVVEAPETIMPYDVYTPTIEPVVAPVVEQVVEEAAAAPSKPAPKRASRRRKKPTPTQ